MSRSFSLLGFPFFLAAIATEIDSSAAARTQVDPSPPSTGSFSALASGVKDSPRQSSFGFFVRGYGGTLLEARNDALTRCRAMGHSCHLASYQ